MSVAHLDSREPLKSEIHIFYGQLIFIERRKGTLREGEHISLQIEDLDGPSFLGWQQSHCSATRLET